MAYSKIIKHWPLFCALLIATALRAGLLYADVVPFNADEAVVALMARHILHGARPIFFYGQVYLGSLDAWLVAGAFALFGQSVLAMRLAQTALYLGTIVTTYRLALAIYADQWIAGVAALLMAVPTVNVTLYTTATLGGYGETLLIGNLLFLLTLHLASARDGQRLPPSSFHWLLFGLLAGLGFWTFPLVLVYLAPAVVYLVVLQRRSQSSGSILSGAARPSTSLLSAQGARAAQSKDAGNQRHSLGRWALAAFGFALGAAPWWWHTLTQGAATVAELSGSAIAGASHPNLVFAFFQHLFNFLLLGLTVIFGLRPPWSARFLALPLAPFALALYTMLLVFLARKASARDAARGGRWLLLGGCLTLAAGFLLTPFGADPSGRYFLPLAAPLALLLAEMLRDVHRRQRRKSLLRGWLVNGVALGLVVFNGWGTLQSAAAFPPGLTTQFNEATQVDQRGIGELMAFLRAQGETRGYANYWVEFPLAFLSQEELIYEARLPYHLDFRYTPRDNRYAPYAQAVADSPRAAYVTTLHPALDERLRAGLAALGVAFQEKQIGDFRVFYALSRKVVPEELGLGVECCP
jgi:4-amino-4-deoxy-L-arabinose transferase-like glycosyltransferase